MLNFGSWAGRLHAVLGAACGANALPTNSSPDLQTAIAPAFVYSMTTMNVTCNLTSYRLIPTE
jgi:hypothetical protein